MFFGDKYGRSPIENIIDDDRRALRRRHLIFYLRVWDLATEKLLGHVVDISVDGVMVISEEPIETGKTFDLEMRWHDPDGTPKTIRFKGQSRWSSNDVNPAFYDTGFLLLDPSDNILEPIKSIIKRFGFDE